MPLALDGLAKLNEECGELVQVIGKMLAWWDTDEPHWDGTVLPERLIEELGDVRAAIEMVSSLYGIHREVGARYLKKLQMLHEWHGEEDNNSRGIEGAIFTAARQAREYFEVQAAAEAIVRFRETGGTMLDGALDGLARALEERHER